MITTNANYDIENAKQNKFPIWVVEFDGITTKFASGTYADISANHKTYIEDIKINNRHEIFVDPRSGNSYAEIDIIDKDAEITSLISADNLLGIQATIKQGFKALDEADFLTVLVGRIEEIDVNKGTYKFTVEDLFPKNDDILFRGIISGDLLSTISKADYAAQSAAPITAGSSVAVIMSVTFFPIHPDLRAGDDLYLDSGTPGTSEWAEVESIDISISTITFVTIVNSYGSAPTIGTRKINIGSALATSLNTSLGNYTTPPFISTTDAYVMIDQEVIKGTYDTTNGILILPIIVGRGLDGTNRVQHVKGTKIKEIYYLVDKPLQILLNLLTTTAAGTNGAYDIGLENWGLGIDKDLVDISGIIGLQTDFFNDFNWQFTFLFSEPNDALNVMAEDILKPLGLFRYISDGGKIKLGKIDQWNDLMSVGDFNNDDFIAGAPSLEYEKIINKTAWNYFYEWGTGSFRVNQGFNLSASITEYGEFPELDVSSRGLRATGGTDFKTYLQTELHRNLVRRYGNPANLLELETKFKNNILELGDVIRITHSFVPNFFNGALGLSNQPVQIRVIDSGTSGVDLKVEVPPKEYVDVGVYSVVTESDINATAGSNADAVYNTTDSALIQGDDAKYDISAGINIDATRVTLNIDFTTDAETISLTARVGTLVGPGMTVVASETKVFPVNTTNGVFIFDGLTLAKYDIKLDFFARTGATPPALVTISSLIYETNGMEYAEI